jgi:hypothetical protein
MCPFANQLAGFPSQDSKVGRFLEDLRGFSLDHMTYICWQSMNWNLIRILILHAPVLCDRGMCGEFLDGIQTRLHREQKRSILLCSREQHSKALWEQSSSVKTLRSGYPLALLPRPRKASVRLFLSSFAGVSILVRRSSGPIGRRRIFSTNITGKGNAQDAFDGF